MSKVALSRIPSLTFYKDELTLARRTDPIPQLICIGKPCSLYQPEVVRCTNLGGQGTDVDWKCEADLPESLRFGRVEVSCEGWSGPGDPYVLKGSCSLEYRLVQVPDKLRGSDEPRFKSRMSNWLDQAYSNPSATIFTIIWTAALLFILYSFLKSCWAGRSTPGVVDRTRPRPPGGGSSPGWFSGNGGPNSPADPPPPYSKYASTSSPNARSDGWQPGFWTGAALGGLGTYLFGRTQRERLRPSTYDWEHDRLLRPSPAVGGYSGFSGWSSGSGRRTAFSSDDRGEGSSNLGSMRRSTGLGGSNVR